MNPRPLLLASFTLASAFSSAVFAQIYTNPTSGDVGIGTTSPQQKLAVNGYIDAQGFLPITNFLIRTNPNDTQTFQTQGSLGKWVFTNNDGGGNVGIGTTSPATKLHVAGSITTHQQIINTGSQANVYVAYTNNGSSRWSTSIGTSEVGGNTGSDFQFSNYNDSGVQISVPLTIQRGTGNVGIGTISPAARLQVNGNVLLNSSATGVTPGFNGEFGNPNVGNSGGFRVNRNSGSAGTKIFSSYHSNSGNEFYHEALSLIDSRFVFLGGNVGIGTTNPTHKLAVNGTIKAKEVIVETSGWSDYVFADDYALAPLAEVEAHIKEHKHLPGIPSAVEVADQGVSLGDMQAKLLAKVEEMTLHMIAQEKRIQRLEAENSELRAR